MKHKRSITLLLALALLLSLPACVRENTPPQASETGNAPAPQPTQSTQATQREPKTVYEVNLWCEGNLVDLTRKQIGDYNARNPEHSVIVASVYAVDAAEAAQQCAEGKADCDLFCFSADQLEPLARSGALEQLDESAAAFVTEGNGAQSVQAATDEGALYAYPMTADDSYVLYYDSSVVTDPGSLEQILEDCEAADKRFCFDLNNAWYMASFFFGTGCVCDWTSGPNDSWIANDTLCSDAGLQAMQAMNWLMNKPCFAAQSSATAFQNGAAAVVGGIWEYQSAKLILGEDLGVAPLPAFTVDGKHCELGAFMNYKLLGVKPQSDPERNAALHKLAQYLSGADAQRERFTMAGCAPTNLEILDSDSVRNDPVQAAVAAQASRTVLQRVPPEWWELAAPLAETAQKYDDKTTLQGSLLFYEAGVKQLAQPLLIFAGAWNDWSNEVGDGAYLLTGEGELQSLTLELPAGDDLSGRIVRPGSWENDKGYAQITVGKELALDLGDNNPDNNIVFAQPGTYQISINTANNEISLQRLDTAQPEETEQVSETSHQ